MSKREDIVDGRVCRVNENYGLIYTCKLGWIDLGHANPANAKELWRKINNEIGRKSRDKSGYKLTHSQSMRKWFLSSSFEKDYYVRLGLNSKQKESVALSIFMEISLGFENLQSKFPRFITDSGFSGEDLISNLVGFYKALRPNQNSINLAEPVSKEAALIVWDKYGAVGQNKNYNFGPQVYPCETCLNSPAGKTCAPLPAWLNTITPEKKGILFRDWKWTD